MKNLSGPPLEGRRLTHKYYTRLERLARDKHSSLLRKSVNYDRNKFYDTGSRSRPLCLSLIMVTVTLVCPKGPVIL